MADIGPVQLAGFLLLVESVEADDGFSGVLVHVAKPILELNACTPSCALWFRWWECVARLSLLRICSTPGGVVGSKLRQTRVIEVVRPCSIPVDEAGLVRVGIQALQLVSRLEERNSGDVLTNTTFLLRSGL